MKARPLHINLLLDEERRSSSPLRTRVMAPMFAGIAALAMLVWSGLSLLTNAMLTRGNATARQQIEDQTATVDRYAEITDRKAALISENQQLDRFLAGCIPFRDALAALAEGMPESAALTRLDFTYPALVPSRGAKPGAKAPPPGATLHLYGITTNPDDVEAIRSTFSTGPATNVVVEASVPSGSFRTDPAAGPGHFRFEIVAKGMPRSFEPPKTAPKKGEPRP